jgi:starch synthase
VTTVSPTYAREIRTPEGGYGLDADLRARRDSVSGILNGVDYDDWNPATDRYLPFRYDANDLTGKARNKAALLDLLRMQAAASAPLVGMVTRLTRQKGIDLLPDVLPKLLQERDVRFVALGSGEAQYERFMHELQQRFPGRVVFYSGYSEELAHFIEAAADIFLMPSLYEPCGLNQMYSLKYGAVPIVRETGGLADTITNTTESTLADRTANGFSFADASAYALSMVIDRAVRAYRQPEVWRQIVETGMNQDWSWDRSARQYVELYERTMAKAPAMA